MTDIFDQVAEFQHAYGQPVAHTPAPLTDDRLRQRWDFLDEEVNTEYTDAINTRDFIEQLDALADTIYIAAGTMIEMVGPDLARRILDEVHVSNLSKLGADGNPIIVGGKVRKGPNYRAPDIANVLSDSPRKHTQEDQ